MTEFGDFANIDIDKLLRGADEQFAKAEQLQQTMADLVGRAEDRDGLIKIEYGQEGLRELEIHPKAMRLAAGELSDRIKATMQDAVADLNRQINDAMVDVFGEEGNPMRFMNDPDGALHQVKQAEAAYERTYEDVMGELERIRRRLDL
ncbi:YbaB/EbfC family nucleoid-associated protein [Nonomuraea sp. LPB2021202275-12-8]|uniref:YbaB/EbfC family nucleoid-associated protein n=1 Tax=Nonomuraea sp. LPB2021202275-12-8 TaxID=3120159 RepID=UPI00300C012B